MTGEDKRATVSGAGGPGAAGGAGIVCHECGATGQVDLFCDSCGAVLRARTSEDVPAQRASGSSASAPAPTPPDSEGFFSPPATDSLSSTTEVAAVPSPPTGPASGSRKIGRAHV